MFQINYCGINVSNVDYDIIDRPYGSGDYLLLYFFTPMEIFFADHTEIAPANSFFLYPPGMAQKYRAVGKFKNSYVHFTAPEELFEQYKIPTAEIFTINHPSKINEYIRELHVELFSKEPSSDMMMDAIMRQLLTTLARNLYQSSSASDSDYALKEQFQAARYEILAHSEYPWNTEAMAKLVHIGKSQFFSYYKAFFNSTPKADLIAARIENAKLLLCNKAYQVNQVAALVGFQNVYHFTRYFKKACGCTPKQYGRN